MSDEITVYQYDPIQVASVSVIPESAPSANNGSIEVTGVTGGVAGGYTYLLFFEAALVVRTAPDYLRFGSRGLLSCCQRQRPLRIFNHGHGTPANRLYGSRDPDDHPI